MYFFAHDVHAFIHIYMIYYIRVYIVFIHKDMQTYENADPKQCSVPPERLHKGDYISIPAVLGLLLLGG